MKCQTCGKIVRKVNGALIAHPCGPDTVRIKRGPRRGEIVASRKLQQDRHYDSGHNDDLGLSPDF